jgi:hypothetical protein
LNIPTAAESVGLLSISTPLLYYPSKNIISNAVSAKSYNRMLYDSSTMTGSETIFGATPKAGVRTTVSTSSKARELSISSPHSYGITLNKSNSKTKIKTYSPIGIKINEYVPKSITDSDGGSGSLSESLSIPKAISKTNPLTDGLTIFETGSLAISTPTTTPTVSPKVEPAIGLAPPEVLTKIPTLPLIPSFGMGGGGSGQISRKSTKRYAELFEYNIDPFAGTRATIKSTKTQSKAIKSGQKAYAGLGISLPQIKKSSSTKTKQKSIIPIPVHNPSSTPKKPTVKKQTLPKSSAGIMKSIPTNNMGWALPKTSMKRSSKKKSSGGWSMNTNFRSL